MTSIRYEVTEGPSKLGLMLALFDKPCPAIARRDVQFTVLIPMPALLSVEVTSVQDVASKVEKWSTGEVWNVEGRVLEAEHLAPNQDDGILPKRDTRVFIRCRTDGDRGESFLKFLP
jgi:hypothetical protein